MSLYGRSKSEVIVTALFRECERIARDDVVDRIDDFQSKRECSAGPSCGEYSLPPHKSLRLDAVIWATDWPSVVDLLPSSDLP